MPLLNGTLVTHYQEIDEFTGYGEKTCSGYDLDIDDKPDFSDICVGLVLTVDSQGIKVQWLHMCTRHQGECTMRGWFDNGELWEIGQLA